MVRQTGFTLIEMAIVLAIIGLLTGGGLMALGPVIDKARTNQTNTALDQIENALVAYAVSSTVDNTTTPQSHLPCPANGSLTNTSANYGVAGTLVGTGTCPAYASPVIPWRSLGLDESYSLDGWGNRISYFVSNTNQNGTTSVVDPTNPILIRTAASYPTGNFIPVYAAANPFGLELTLAPNRAAYVLISHGRSGWYARNKAGNLISPPGVARVIKAYNQAGTAGTGGTGNGFVQGTPIGRWPDNGNANYFDDIVRWRSPALIIQLCGVGACGNK